MNSANEFLNKRYIVTGATSGIGRKIVVDLIENGATVLAIGRRAEKLNELKSLNSGKIVAAELDVTDFVKLKETIDGFTQDGKVDGCVHSAGMNKFTPLRIFNWGVFEKMMKVNLAAGIELTKLVSSKKVSNDTCSIVMIASVAGMKGEVGFTAYSATKGALIAAVKSMAMELASSNVRVNAISPGVVDTDLTKTISNFYPHGMEAVNQKHPLGIGNVEDVSALALFLLSQKSKWITGANYVIDGGYSEA